LSKSRQWSVIRDCQRSYFEFNFRIGEKRRLTTDNEQLTAVKESSDELNPAVAIPAREIAPRRRPTAGDYLALAIATCGGIGYAPIAPGTLGSILAIVIYVLMRWLTLNALTRFAAADSFLHFDPQPMFIALESAVILLITLIGIWAATRVERLDQKKDPSKVVIDEVAGQLVALLPIPLWVIGPSRLSIGIAFLFFRAFDIVKPYPIRRLERLESGLGIVIDDLAAGAYAAVVLSIIIAVWFVWP